ncbi:MAG: DUF4157 domain-containing protein [Gemmatimonas sp.]|nr:DUF4157 domain-containing protein [Gemmatimonas sp.]
MQNQVAGGTDAAPATTPSTASRISEMRGSGQPLTPSARSYFEPRFGANFTNVRVHTDKRAGDSARSLSALAYTIGPDIVFAPGQFAPETPGGRRLLAHELSHVLQQGNASRIMRKVRFEPESEKGASNEALAFFADIGLPASNYEFTSFEGGRATVEGRGSRPSTVSAEIGWAYLTSSDLYERKATKMRQDLAEREALISNARTVGPALMWGEIVKGGGKVNASYWEIVRGAGGVQMRTKQGADSADAMDDVRANPGMYSVECFASVAMIEMLTERERLGADKFRQRYPQLVIHFTTAGGVITSLDVQGLTEWDVGSLDNTRELIPGDQSNWKNSATGFNENFIYLGSGQYFAHPAGIVSGKATFASRVSAAGAVADLFMTRYRYRWDRWLPP